MIKNYLLLFLFFIVITEAYSQEKKITGTITSAEDDLGLPGVLILIKGTTKGTISDIDGKYIPEGVKTLTNRL